MSAAAPTATAAEMSPKHQAILDAARRLFMAHGYGPVSMDAVARAAGVSKATLYAHFASKDRLFATIVGGACARMGLEESSLPDGSEDLPGALRIIGARLLRFLLAPDTQAILRIVIAESARFPELGGAFLSAGPAVYLARMRDWIAAQHAAGRLAAPDPTLAADQFGALLRPFVFLRALVAVPPLPDEAEIAATVEAAVATFLRAYGVRGEQPGGNGGAAAVPA